MAIPGLQWTPWSVYQTPVTWQDLHSNLWCHHPAAAKICLNVLNFETNALSLMCSLESHLGRTVYEPTRGMHVDFGIPHFQNSPPLNFQVFWKPRTLTSDSPPRAKNATCCLRSVPGCHVDLAWCALPFSWLPSPADPACFCCSANSFQTIVLTVYNSECIIVISKMFTSKTVSTMKAIPLMLEPERGRFVFTWFLLTFLFVQLKRYSLFLFHSLG